MKHLSSRNPVRFSIVVLSFLSFFSVTSHAQITYSSTSVPVEFTAGSGSAFSQVGDFDKDGDIDIIIMSVAGGAISYYQNDGSGNFSLLAGGGPFSNFTSSTPIGFSASSVASYTADFDNDGDLDIWCRINGAANDVYLSNNSGTYVSATTPLEFSAASGSGLSQIGDYDNDGDIDAIMMTVAGGAISYYQNNGSGTFTLLAGGGPFSNFTSSTPATFTSSPASCYTADFDNDGDLDLWCRANGAANDVYLRNSSGTYTSVTSPIEYSASASGLVQIGDYDGDGDIDAAMMTAIGSAIVYYQNDGSGTFTLQAGGGPFSNFVSSTPTNFTASYTVTYTADLDNDGDFDIWCRINGAANDIYLSASGVAPRITSSTPANNATSVSPSANIVLNFNETITAGTGNIYIRKFSDNSIAETIAAAGARVNISGNVVTIDPITTLSANTAYYLTFDKTAFRDADNVIFGRADLRFNVRIAETRNTFLKFTTTGTLPLTLLSFTGKQINDAVLLQWKTTDEINTDGFDVERSLQGSNFTIIGTVTATGSGTNDYHFTDQQTEAGKSYLYRLKMRDKDGKFTYSSTIAVQNSNNNKKDNYLVYPNPLTSTYLYVQPVNGNDKDITVTISGVDGKLLYNKNIAAVNGRIEIPVQTLSPGIYILKISNPKEVLQVTKFKKQ